MSNVFTDSAVWSAFVQTAYDRQVAFFLRDQPQWRQMIDKRPGQQAMPGATVTLNIHNAMPLATGTLAEDIDIDAVAPGAPTPVNVVLAEYGNATVQSLRLRELAFDKPESELAMLVGMNMADSVDAIIRATADGSTNLIGFNGGTLKSTATSFAANSVVATDIMARKSAVAAGKLLQRKKVMPKQGGKFVAIIHPDISFDLQAETGATAWVAPHTDGTDTQAIYTGVVGDFMGSRYVETTRVTITPNTQGTPVPVYSTYYFGREALVEATAIDPHIVLGPQVDKLKRFWPLGWHALFGHSIYRPDALVVNQAASSIGAL